MKFLLILAALLVLCHAVSYDNAVLEEWEAYKTKFNKKYDTDEEDKLRLNIYMKTKESIAKHNAKYAAGLTTYRQGITPFTDMTEEEFGRMFG